MVRVGFLSNQLGLRGTEVAMYDYADLNETLLGNQSVIVSFRDAKPFGNDGLHKFLKRFKVVLLDDASQLDDVARENHLDSMYIIKGGWVDDRYVTACKCCVHAVFRSDTPHGDAFSVISSFVNAKFETRYSEIPHIVRPGVTTTADLRQQLGIPESAVVFGRHGGTDSFDMQEAKDAVITVATQRPDDRFFVFLNTDAFGPKLKNVIFLPGTPDPEFKQMFINTCDTMLHARRDGETFGLSCAEFAILGKRVYTYEHCKDRHHIDALGDNAVLYSGYDDLCSHLTTAKGVETRVPAYTQFSPGRIMQLFRNFVNPSVTVVVSHCHGELTWVNRLWHRTAIYSKATEEQWKSCGYFGVSPAKPNIQVCLQENRGNEALAYLTFIVSSYDCLPEEIIFVHDHELSWHHDGSIVDKIHGIDLRQASYINLNKFPRQSLKDAGDDPKIAFKDAHLAFEHPPNLDDIAYDSCAMFAVTRDRILRKPKEFYQRCLEYIMTSQTPTFFVSRLFEYTWAWMFDT